MMLFDYIAFIKEGADWTQFGIEIYDKTLNEPLDFQIEIMPFPNNGSYPSQGDNLRYDQIVELFGCRWFFNVGWFELPFTMWKVYRLFKVCKRVNALKAFL